MSWTGLALQPGCPKRIRRSARCPVRPLPFSKRAQWPPTRSASRGRVWMGKGKETSEEIRPWKGRGGGYPGKGHHECTCSIASEANRFGCLQQPLRLAKAHLSARRPLGAMPALRARDDLFHARLDRRRQAALARRDAGEAGRASAGVSLHPFDRGADHLRRQGLAPWSRDSSGELARLGKRRRADRAARRAAEALRAAGLNREARPAPSLRHRHRRR